MNRQKLEKEFINPSLEYSLVPFWFWNGDLRYEELERQLHEMISKNVMQFIIHARRGLLVPYLSQEWFDRVKHTVEKAKEMGMKAWIYDEENWPSGYAGGVVIEGQPDFRAKNLKLTAEKVRGQTQVELAIPDGELVSACAYKLQGCENSNLLESEESLFVVDVNTYHDVSDRVSDGKLSLNLLECAGDWLVCFFTLHYTDWWAAYSNDAYVDLLDEKVVQKFIETTHVEYEKRVGEYFGDTVVGFFTDEPGFYNNFWDRNPQTVPWTRRFLEYFESQKGYDLKPYLLLLWHNGISEHNHQHKVRYDYYDVFSKLYQQTFFKRLYDWCGQRNLQSIGHVNNEELIVDHSRYSGHFFRSMRYLHTPGIDVIEGKRAKDSIVPKLVSSASHLFSASRTMSETYGVFGWKMTMEEMKWTADWQYVRGVNLMVPHAFYYSIEGDRRNECPPSEFFQNTWWKYFEKYSDYMRRLSFLLSQGRHVADIAVYYPIASIWANLAPGDAPIADDIDETFRVVSDELLCNQLDFDYLDDDAFVDIVRVEDGKLKANDEEFDILILPHVTTIPLATLVKLEEFQSQGGTIIAVDTLPNQCVEWTKDAEISVRMAKLVAQMLRLGRDDIMQASCFRTHTRDVLLSEKNRDIKYLHRRMGNTDAYFIVNESPDKADIEITFRSSGIPQEWNPEMGEIAEVQDYTRENGRTAIPLTLYGWNSTVIVFDSDRKPEPCISKKLVEKGEIEITGEWNFSLEGEVEQRQIRELQSWTEFGFPHYSGSAVYEKCFDVPPDFAAGILVLDLGDVHDTAEVWLNEKFVGVRVWRPYHFDVTEHVKKGGNKLKIIVTNTLENEFNRNPLPSGLLGKVRLLLFTRR